MEHLHVRGLGSGNGSLRLFRKGATEKRQGRKERKRGVHHKTARQAAGVAYATLFVFTFEKHRSLYQIKLLVVFIQMCLSINFFVAFLFILYPSV